VLGSNDKSAAGCHSATGRLTQAIGISSLREPSFIRLPSSCGRLCLQQAITKKNNQEISLKYHAVIDIVGRVVRPPYPRSDRRKFGRIYQRFCFTRSLRFAAPSI
jgi:hypothetical protein